MPNHGEVFALDAPVAYHPSFNPPGVPRLVPFRRTVRSKPDMT